MGFKVLSSSILVERNYLLLVHHVKNFINRVVTNYVEVFTREIKHVASTNVHDATSNSIKSVPFEKIKHGVKVAISRVIELQLHCFISICEGFIVVPRNYFFEIHCYRVARLLLYVDLTVTTGFSGGVCFMLTVSLFDYCYSVSSNYIVNDFILDLCYSVSDVYCCELTKITQVLRLNCFISFNNRLNFPRYSPKSYWLKGLI